MKHRRSAHVFASVAVCAFVGAGCESSNPAHFQPPLVATAAPRQEIAAGSFVPSHTAGPAVALTASDGTGLRLASLSARAVVEDPLAFTEMRLVFDNPEGRTLEGNFRITLPKGASISRFAMRIGDQWQEGEVVEKQAAREAYEDFLHRRQDPALLEQAAGNEFSARVFPIPANARKEIIISFSHEVPQDGAYTLPLGGLPAIESVDVEVYSEGRKEPLARLVEKNFAPKGDYTLDRAALGASEGVRGGEFVVARVPVPGDNTPDPLRSVVLLVDTSASRAAGFSAELALVEKIARHIAASGDTTNLVVACFDQDVERIYEGPAAGFGANEIKKIEARGALGASDLRNAIFWAAVNTAGKRLLVVTDGVVTAGETEAARLVTAADELTRNKFERLDVVAVGGIQDESTLEPIVRSKYLRHGVVADGSLEWKKLVSKLERKTRSDLFVEVKGARDFQPRMIHSAQVGDEALVYAEVEPGSKLEVVIDGQAKAPVLRQISSPLVERAWAKARIDALLAENASGEAKEAIKQKIIALSTKHRVLSPYTSLLVLETENDYERFHIDRKALVDILTVEGGRMSLRGRRDPASLELAGPAKPTAEPQQGAGPVLKAPPPPAGGALAPTPISGKEKKTEDSPSLDSSGGLGLSGVGESASGSGDESIGLGSGGQGFGAGHGRLSGSHRTKPPQIRQGATTVSGKLPPEVIQRIVRQNFGRFRLCYEKGLERNPNLQGRVSVQFTIDRQGNSTAVHNQGSTLPDPSVISCIVRAFYGFSFPVPEGGIVLVTYPINFSNGDGGPTTPGSRAQPREEELLGQPATATPYTGRYKDIQEMLSAGKIKEVITETEKWVGEEPGDLLALTGLGEAYAAAGDLGRAARAFGSLIDLFPARADYRRYAGARLEALGAAGAKLAIDTFEKAHDERPDHPSSHRLFAMALLRENQPEKAFEVLVAAIERQYPENRFRGVDRILREDLGLAAAAWIRAEPQRKAEIAARLEKAGGTPEKKPSLRFVINWETDANDVDFHIYDAKSRHAYYGHPRLGKDGGELYADVTTGYGPECFTVRKPRGERSASYTLQAHYFSRGPMGYGMGKLEIIDHDGQGKIEFVEKPFVVMQDGAYINLGQIGRDGKSLAPPKK